MFSLTDPNGIGDDELRAFLCRVVAGEHKKVLLIPPDFTRLYSGGGKITAMLYEMLADRAAVDILPALGTHRAMTEEEWHSFFGTIPYEKMIVHNWRTDVITLGEVPRTFVREVSEELVDETIPVEVNRRLVDGGYDLILSVGQVVPHEVVGMSNYTKNILVGCGGSAMIGASHAIGAFYGMERLIGRDHSPVRAVFDYAETHFLTALPLCYLMTVATERAGETVLHGIFCGRERDAFEHAVALSQEKNIIRLPKPIRKAVVYLDPREFKSTWLGNKAIYRTRMAMADGGELIVLAPGVERFGEDAENDRLIRHYGYRGRERTVALAKTDGELAANLSVAAHLIHGSSDGRFSVTYATALLSENEVRGVGFDYLPYETAIQRYDPNTLTDGWQTVGGEEIFYISNPALGLWAAERN